MSALFAEQKFDYSTSSFPAPRPFQQTAHEALRQGFRDGHKNQIICSPTGSGKCLGKDTPVMLADGSVKMVQDIVAGDLLMGDDGTPRLVLSTATGKEMLYRVTPIKGDPYIVNASHLLSLKKAAGCDGIVLSDGTHIKKNDDVVAVRADVYYRSNQTAKTCLKGWRSSAISRFHREDREEDRLIPPYLLGAWLGDGSVGQASISKPPCKMVEAWIEFGRSCGLGVSVSYGSTGCPTWLLTNGQDGYRYNTVQGALEIIGVANFKHIPDEYKFAPLQDRLELIAGLIDSDGHITHGGCDWVSKSERLAKDFAFVCRSVGLSCYLSYQKKTIKSLGFEGWYWRASVSGDLSILPMRDKIASPRRQIKRHLVHGITLEPIGVGDYYGFEISGNRLFLLGDFTVTHNTYLGLRIISEALARGKKAVFVCDRTTLINQTSDTADQYGLSKHGVIQAQHHRRNSSYPFQIASVQTIAKRQFWPEADVIVIDECHSQYSEWVNHAMQTKAAVIGLSATPLSAGLGKIFTNLVNAATMHELTESGVLTPMRIFSCKRIDMKGAATAGGEWTDKAAGERGMEIVGDVVSEWVKYGEGRKTICFGATIAHCEEISRRFNEAGVMAAVFTSNTTASERESLLKEYRKHDSVLRVLCSVEALSKGFDIPSVSCVIDCRPLRKSLSTAIQMWGRGLRSSKDTGKTDCRLIDHSGNIQRFLADFTDFYFNGLDSLDSGEKLDKEVRKDDDSYEPKGCPSCGYKPFASRCMSCGFEMKKADLHEHIPGESHEIFLGKKKLADDTSHLLQQLSGYVRKHSAPDKQAGRMWHLYKKITGKDLPRGFNVAACPAAEITPNVASKIRSLNIAYVKGRKAA